MKACLETGSTGAGAILEANDGAHCNGGVPVGNSMIGRDPGSRSSKRSSSLSTSFVAIDVSVTRTPASTLTGMDTDAAGTSTCCTSSGSLEEGAIARTAPAG